MQVALKYLRTTRLANEDIALALGFSDAANFRRAFAAGPTSHPARSEPNKFDGRLVATKRRLEAGQNMAVILA
jgi:transcriptional regulator GlxA family with amidase domain